MAEKNILMQRKKADGTFDTYYPKTKVANVEGIPKNNFNASSKPTTNDDSVLGYTRGSRWIFNGMEWVCVNDTVGEAKWKATTAIDPVIFYNRGDQKTSITGGWEEGFNQGGSNVFSCQPDHMYLSSSFTGANSYITAVTSNAIDFSDIDRLKVEIDFSSQIDGLFDIRISENKQDLSYVIKETKNTNLNGIIELDVSSLNGLYYIKLIGWTASANSKAEAEIYKVWGE